MWHKQDRLAAAIWVKYIVKSDDNACEYLPRLSHMQQEFGCSRAMLMQSLAELSSRQFITNGEGSKWTIIQRSAPFAQAPLLGLLIPTFDNDVVKHIYEGVQAAADHCAATVIPMQHNQSIKAEQACLQHVINAGCQSVVICPAHRALKDIDRDYLNKEQYPVPLVLLQNGLSYHDYPTVGIDDYQLGYDVTRKLISIGHTRISCMVCKPAADVAVNGAVIARYRGYLNAMIAAHLHIDDDQMMVVDPRSFEGFFRPLTEYLIRWNEMSDKPTALICFDDQCAEHVYRVASEQGIDIEGKLALAGFDNIAGLQDLPLVLSTNNDFFSMGRIACRLALHGVRHGHYVVPANVIVRNRRM